MSSDNMLRRNRLPNSSLRTAMRPTYYRVRHFYWEVFGRPYEMMNSKRQSIIENGHFFNCSILVETGSYLGDTIEICRHHYKAVLSIELSNQLHEFCKWRFKKCPNVSLFCGDSIEVLPGLLELVGDQRALFWLDGHYSGGSTALGRSVCPLISELEAIRYARRRNDHIILIDDARLFGTYPGYPTLEQAYDALLSINSAYQISIENDIIYAVV